MRNIYLLFCWIVGSVGVLCAPSLLAAQPDASIRIGTYNLRYVNPDDGANAWPLRKDAVKALIRFHELDLFGTQEALAEQISDLSQMQEYAHVGVGRDDGKSAGEHSAIFYKSKRFAAIRHGDFWLSPTPDRPSKGWDAECCNRIASWVHLRDSINGRTFFVFSAHFDHIGVVARRESAKLMLLKIQQIAGSDPVICLGDLNSTPDTVPIQIMRSGLRDVRDISDEPPYGPEATFNGFAFNTTPTERIDYIFVSRQIRALKTGTLTDSNAGRYPSDHFPVVAKILIKR